MLITSKSPAQILTLNDRLAPFKFGFSTRSQSLIGTIETGNWNLAIGTKVHPVSRSTVIMYRVKLFWFTGLSKKFQVTTREVASIGATKAHADLFACAQVALAGSLMLNDVNAVELIAQ